MAKQKSMTREFNRLTGNLNELHRRVFATDKDYPRGLCAEWFVSDLTTIVENEALNIRLTDDDIDVIVIKSNNLLHTELLNKDDKKNLRNLVQKLKLMKVNEVQQCNIK